MLTPNMSVDLVIRALDNERAIDIRYREISGLAADDNALPNYKVMKQLALRRRFGASFTILTTLAPFLTMALFFYQWGSALIGALFPRSVAHNSTGVRTLATSSQGSSLIKAALSTCGTLSNADIRALPLSCFQWGRQLGVILMLRCLIAHLRLIFILLKLPRGERRDLILHASDSFALLMMALDVSRNHYIHITDDHYQRWSFILSHVASDFRIVQHGFLDSKIKFPHSFGNIKKLYTRDLLFSEQFQRIYHVSSSVLFSPQSQFIETVLSSRALFLASSFPAIDAEIELITALRRQRGLPVIVKFHPAHTYDERRTRLARLADFVFEGDGNPACRIFVSFNSFMEFDYKNCGIPTVSIARSGGATQACGEILEIINSKSIYS
jgi:hypothetical protein